MNPILNVIVPVYNTGINLQTCLDSILNQTIKNISIIIVDDCSTDNLTKSIITAYSEKHNNIEVIYNDFNIGPGLSRNVGLRKASGDYIAFLDSDDWIDLNAYQKCIDFMSKNIDCDIAIFNIITEYDNYNSSKLRYTYTDNVINNSMAMKLLCNSHRFNQTLSPLIGNRVHRKSIFDKNHIEFISSLYEDDYFSFLCFKNARNIALLSDVSLHYYQRNNSIMHTFSKKNVVDLFSCFNQLKKYLKSQNDFDTNKHIYFSYFERCTKSLLKQLFSVESDIEIQRKYIKLFFNLLHKHIDINDYIDYLDIERIKEFFI